MKNSPILLLLGLTLLAPQLSAATRNLCDDLIDSGASEEQVTKCQAKFGVSLYAKEKAEKDGVKKAEASAKGVEAAKKSDNIEFKKFSESDLVDAGFGKDFYAIRGDYRNYQYKEKRITEGDSLCQYLGFEKAIQSKISPEILPEVATKKGLVVDTNLFGSVKKEPELYVDKDLMFTVKKYVEITCAKRLDKELDPKNEALKSITEVLVEMPKLVNANKDKDIIDQNESSRGKKEGTTTHGFKVPEWAKDQATTTGK